MQFFRGENFQTSLRNGALLVLAWMAWVAYLHGKCASMVEVGGVCDVLACVGWVVCLCGWHASVDAMSGVLTWVVCDYYCYCYY